MNKWFKYVQYYDVEEYKRNGWVVVDADPYFTHHDYYSCIMEYIGEGEPTINSQPSDTTIGSVTN